MKQKLYILGLVTAIVVFLGTLFKLNHWPGAGFLLLFGIFTLVMIFIPLALRNDYKERGNPDNRILYIVTWVTCFVVFVAMLFKIQHWSGAWFALIISLPFPFVVFLPVYLIVTGKNKNHNIYNTVYVLFLLAVISAFTALLALGVSKERMVDSLGFARNYNKVETLALLPSADPESTVNKKAEDLIKITEELKDLNFMYYGINEDQWKSDPEVLMTSGSWQKKPDRLLEQEFQLRMKLLAGLRDFILLMEKTPGYDDLARSAPAIFNLRKTPSGSYNWESDEIVSSLQPWFLIYLEGLEANLLMIRATL